MKNSNKNNTKEILLPILTNLGTDYRCFKIAHTLKEAGYFPIIVCDKPVTAPGKSWSSIKIVELTNVSHLQNFSRSFIQFNFRLIFYLLRTKSKIWIVEDCPPLLTAALLAKIKRAKILYDAHEIILETPHVSGGFFKKYFWKFWHNTGFLLADKIITVSPFFVEHFKKKFPKKSYFVLPNMPIKQPGEVPPINIIPDRIELLFQGYLRKDANLKPLINVLVHKKNIFLTIVGSGEDELILKNQVKNLNLEARVTFKGSVPFDDLTVNESRFNFGIHIVKPTSLNMDLTWGNKVFEYCHKLLPVLVSHTKGMDSILNKYPLGVQIYPDSEKSISEGLEKLTDNYAQFQRNCLKFSNELSWQKYEKDFLVYLTT